MASRFTAAFVPCLVGVSLATDYMVPMRDGVKLHTVVDEPPFFPADKKVPAVLERSPYGDNQEELIALVAAEALGYVAVRQDFRGTGQSEGTFGLWHDSHLDAYDTIEWILQQPWNNGEVFTTGVSADAIDEYAQIVSPHPALRGQVNVFGTTNGWETFYVGGAYREALIDGWLKKTVPSDFPVDDLLVKNEEQPGTPWWQLINGTNYYQNVSWPSLHWAGWYDIFQQGNLEAYWGYQHSSNASAGVRGQAKLVVDPLGHCQSAAPYFSHDTTFGRVLLPFLMALDFMADNSVTNKTFPDPPEGVGNVTLYVMGAEEPGSPGQYWTSLPDYPVNTPTNYYLHPDGSLDTNAPSSGSADSSISGNVSYVYDPANPVPSIGGDNLFLACGPLDQRPDEARSDVLIFTGEALAQPLAMTGELTVTLYLSTNVTDTDMVVKLIDVYPVNSANASMANSSTLVADGILRMKWRGFPSQGNEPSFMSGNEGDVYTAHFTLWNTSYIFAPGHKIRVHVTSSNYPRFSPNPNTGIWMNETQGNMTINATAHTTLHMMPGYPSYITLPVVDAASQLPPFPVEETITAMAARYANSWNEQNRLAKAAGVDIGAERATLSFTDWLQVRLARVAKTFSRQ